MDPSHVCEGHKILKYLRTSGKQTPWSQPLEAESFTYYILNPLVNVTWYEGQVILHFNVTVNDNIKSEREMRDLQLTGSPTETRRRNSVSRRSQY